MSLTSFLFKAARIAASGRAIRRTMETGDPRPVVRRAKNVLVGRALARAGFWRRLWK